MTSGGANDKIEKAMDKAQEAAAKFMDDPEKVAKARTKAEGYLEKYMDAETADKVTNMAEELLGSWAHKGHEGSVDE